MEELKALIENNQMEEQKKFYGNVIAVLRNDLAIMADQKATQAANAMQLNEKVQMLTEQLSMFQIQNNDLTEELIKVNKELFELKAKYAGPVDRFNAVEVVQNEMEKPKAKRAVEK
jgi:Na+/phosphate symporter